jgi:hypothetical protein
VLLNTGIDELSNPRLRDARSATKIANRRVWTTDPTPVFGAQNGHRGGLAGLAHSFSRKSLIDEAAVGTGNAEKAGELR